MNPDHRSGLPLAPPSIDALPVDRGYPVPDFVAWVDGKPEFRAMDGRKLSRDVTERRCWVCGKALTTNRVTYVIGPMCVVNRISAEPPSHRECAEYSVKACPFLSRPEMVRRENDMPDQSEAPPGIMLRRNPGVTCLWTTRNPGATIIRHGGGLLFQIWPATEVSFWCRGRLATRREVLESVDSGLPSLMDLACKQGAEAIAQLEQMVVDAGQYWPEERESANVR